MPGSAAFRWLDANMIQSLVEPDEALDWVYLATPEDWALLEAAWDSRSPDWREAMAYVVGNGPTRESRSLLRRGLFDRNLRVAQQSGISLCHQYVEFPEDAVPIDPELVARMREIVAVSGESDMDPVPEFLARHPESFEAKWLRWVEEITALEQVLKPIANREAPPGTDIIEFMIQCRNSPHPADETGTRERITALFNELVDTFPALSYDERMKLIDLLNENHSLMWSAIIDAVPTTEAGFRRRMILFILEDQGRDFRDAIVELTELSETGREAGLDVFRIRQELGQLASDRNKFGTYGESTRELIMN